MQYYEMWFNLKEGHRDMDFVGHARAYLDHLKDKGLIQSWRLTRRKFGFGPEHLGEFNITVMTNDLAQLDAAFSLVATRDGQVESLHRPVYSAVKDFRSALYRDFPDPERVHG
ncbi:MAG: DUF6614 family protein [Phycisphaerales bacterium]